MDNMENRGKLILDVAQDIEQLLHHVKEKYQTTPDIHCNALLFTVFRGLKGLILANQVPKEHVESYLLTLLNDYMAEGDFSLYVSKYDSVPQPTQDKLN